MTSKKRTSYVKKEITTRTGRKLIATRERIKFPRSIYFKRGVSNEEIEEVFETRIKPVYEEFWKKQTKRKNGNKFIFSIQTGMNFKGKRLKSGYSTPRTKVGPKQRNFNYAMQKWKNGFLDKKGFFQKIKRYLAKSGLTSFSIKGISVEVVRDDVRPKAKSKPKKSKPKKVRRN